MVYIERTFTTQIGSDKTEVLYSTNFPETLKAELTERYVGKCFKYCYIIQVLDIVRHSPVILEWNRNGGNCRIAVTFKVRAIIYDRGEVIPDCKIVEIMDNGKIILRSQYSACILAPNAKLQSFKIGQTVPVRVVNPRYVPGRNNIAVQAIPFVPMNEPDKEFNVQLDIKENKEALEPLLARLAEEQEKWDKLDKKTRDAWNSLLNPPRQKPPAGFKEIDISKVTGAGLVLRPEWTDLGSTNVWFKPETQEKEFRNSVQVLRGYLNSSIKALNTAVQLANLYDPKDEEPWMALYKREKKA